MHLNIVEMYSFQNNIFIVKKTQLIDFLRKTIFLFLMVTLVQGTGHTLEENIEVSTVQHLSQKTQDTVNHLHERLLTFKQFCRRHRAKIITGIVVVTVIGVGIKGLWGHNRNVSRRADHFRTRDNIPNNNVYIVPNNPRPADPLPQPAPVEPQPVRPWAPEVPEDLAAENLRKVKNAQIINTAEVLLDVRGDVTQNLYDLFCAWINETDATEKERNLDALMEVNFDEKEQGYKQKKEELIAFGMDPHSFVEQMKLDSLNNNDTRYETVAITFDSFDKRQAELNPDETQPIKWFNKNPYHFRPVSNT